MWSRRLTTLPESSETLNGKRKTFTIELKFFNCFGTAPELPQSHSIVRFQLKLGKTQLLLATRYYIIHPKVTAH